jgi:hypothetical protein
VQAIATFRQASTARPVELDTLPPPVKYPGPLVPSLSVAHVATVEPPELTRPMVEKSSRSTRRRTHPSRVNPAATLGGDARETWSEDCAMRRLTG